jgi:hypothetical protein
MCRMRRPSIDRRAARRKPAVGTPHFAYALPLGTFGEPTARRKPNARELGYNY